MSEADYRDLFRASWIGDLDKIQELIKKGCFVNHVYKSRSSDMYEVHTTLLITASLWSRVNIVKYLLDEGANPNIRTSNSHMTAIDFAFRNSCYCNKDNNLKVIKMLIYALNIEYIEEMGYHGYVEYCPDILHDPYRYLLNSIYVSSDMFNYVTAEITWKRRRIIILEQAWCPPCYC